MGAVSEQNYLVDVVEVYKGGIYVKRVGKNTVHVYSGQGFQLGTECGVALNVGGEYLFTGEPRLGTTAQETARINVNNCTLAKTWSNVGADAYDFLKQVLQANSTGQCLESTPTCPTPPSCAQCTATQRCLTNAFQGSWCGPCKAWCVPNEYFA